MCDVSHVSATFAYSGFVILIPDGAVGCERVTGV